jgi:hypothetical protein
VARYWHEGGGSGGAQPRGGGASAARLLEALRRVAAVVTSTGAVVRLASGADDSLDRVSDAAAPAEPTGTMPLPRVALHLPAEMLGAHASPHRRHVAAALERALPALGGRGYQAGGEGVSGSPATAWHTPSRDYLLSAEGEGAAHGWGALFARLGATETWRGLPSRHHRGPVGAAHATIVPAQVLTSAAPAAASHQAGAAAIAVAGDGDGGGDESDVAAMALVPELAAALAACISAHAAGCARGNADGVAAARAALHAVHASLRLHLDVDEGGCGPGAPVARWLSRLAWLPRLPRRGELPELAPP